MSKADMINPLESLWHWVAYDLRRYRKAHSQTQAQIAAILGVSFQVLCNYEANDRKLQPDQAAKLDKLWTTGGHFSRLVYYARLNHNPDWFKQWNKYESRALILWIYEGLWIPGPIQTPGYARACLLSGRVPDLETVLQQRVKRRAILTRPGPPDAWVIIDQAAIVRPVGGADVHREQLQYLLDLGEMQHISLRVVPFAAGAYQGLDGGFSIAHLPDGDAAYAEAAEAGRLVQDPLGVEDFTARFARIGAKALPEDLARSLIVQQMESL